MFLLIELHINICIQLFLGCQWVVALDWSSSWLHNQPIEMHNKLERNTELYLCEIRMTNWFDWIVHFYIWKSMKWMFVVVEMMRFEMKHFQMVFVHRSEYCLWFSHFLRTKERAKSRKTKTNLKNGISNHLKNVDECFEKYSLCPFLSHSDQIPYGDQKNDWFWSKNQFIQHFFLNKNILAHMDIRIRKIKISWTYPSRYCYR